MVRERRVALVALQEAPLRGGLVASVTSLGLVLHRGTSFPEPAAIVTASVDDNDATIRHARPVVCEGEDATDDRAAGHLAERTARLRDRLAAVRPAMARLRSVLPDRRDAYASRRQDFIELAVADVTRSLVQARRSLRSLAAELAELEVEGRDLIAHAATLERGTGS